jgi:ATP-binding cassette subfamily G (WHITE) protein 2
MFQVKMSNLDEFHETHVRKMMEALGISHTENTLIGSDIIRGVSGGERKRASIAIEFLKHPNVIFLDEPTTGLDSHSAETVIEICNMFAQMGRTVVATVHQPSS